MSGVDVQIVAIVIIFASAYGIFNYMYAQGSIEDQTINMPDVNYTNPESGNFFNTVDEIRQLNVDNPEIWFVNSILFTVIAFMIVFIGLRYLRGTG